MGSKRILMRAPHQRAGAPAQREHVLHATILEHGNPAGARVVDRHVRCALDDFDARRRYREPQLNHFVGEEVVAPFEHTAELERWVENLDQ